MHAKHADISGRLTAVHDTVDDVPLQDIQPSTIRVLRVNRLSFALKFFFYNAADTWAQKYWRRPTAPCYTHIMDTVLDRPWTTETFLAWEDRQEGKHEFDGQTILPTIANSVAHQWIVLNLCLALRGRLSDRGRTFAQSMQFRIGNRIRSPDVLISTGPLDQTVRTLTDAVAIFEVLSDDTATTDRVAKLTDYAAVPSLRAYVLIEQTTIGATLFRREPGTTWTAEALTSGTLTLPGLDISLPLAEIYQGLTFPA